MKDLMLQLEEAGFKFDNEYNKFIQQGFNETQYGIEITDNGLVVSVCGDNSPDFEDLDTFQTFDDAINFLNGVD